ncbi:hypothetical protein CK203_083828 [Vitis vinifera]|uniref:Uncharacterized protein n=1 Tax=Vitis vinifera TaxID=29760 RepID=A0A438DLS8_VITVI|nr:hypothetical protein CK203_083828 [Vitis vinifera]
MSVRGGIAYTSTDGRGQKGGRKCTKVGCPGPECPIDLLSEQEFRDRFHIPNEDKFSVGFRFPLPSLLNSSSISPDPFGLSSSNCCPGADGVQRPRYILPFGPLFVEDKDRRGQLVEWVEKASFDWFNKLFEISATKPNHQVLLTDKNLQTIVREPKLFILPSTSPFGSPVIGARRASRVEDLPCYEVARVADSKARQDRLEQREKKRQDRTLKANSIHKPPDFQLYRPSSCQEEGSSHLACSKATKSIVRIPFSFCFNFFTSSSSVANIEPNTEVDLSTAKPAGGRGRASGASYSL